MKKIILWGAISCILVFNIKAQEIDSLQLENIMMFDSLINEWASNKNIDTQQLDYFYNIDHQIDIADSIIIQRLRNIPTPIQLSFTPEVNSWIRMYFRRGKYLIPTYLALSQYYFPMFEYYLDRYNVPLELKYLAIVESALNPRARSRAGATGIWQFMLGTGRLYGLEVNSFVDERMDPEKATEAAARHLSDLYGIFNDWILAIAAYNCGAGNVRKAIVRSGGKTNFWEIYKYLPRETRGYVPAFVAMTYIMTYADKHNYKPANLEWITNTDTIIICDTLHLMQVATILDIDYATLKNLNPQYKLDIIPGFYKPYPLRLPADKVAQFIIKEREIYALADSVEFYNRLYVANSRAYGGRGYDYTPCNQIQTKNLVKIQYTVRQGESISTIAQNFNVSITEIKCWNNLASSRIRAGQVLNIYKPASKADYYKQLAQMTDQQLNNIKKIQSKAQPSTFSDANYIYYTLKPGDNLYTIAQQFEGITHIDLMNINGFSKYEARNLKPGQTIKIKKK